MASASGAADPTACTTGKPNEQRRHAHRLRGIRGRSPNTGTAVEQRFFGVRPARRSTSPPLDFNRPQQLSSALTVERAKIARLRSQTQITALGNLPNAVTGEP